MEDYASNDPVLGHSLLKGMIEKKARTASFVPRLHRESIRSPCRTVFNVALHSQDATTVKAHVLRLAVEDLKDLLLVKL